MKAADATGRCIFNHGGESGGEAIRLGRPTRPGSR